VDLSDARVVLDAVTAHAEGLGLAVSCSVVDAEGHEVLTARMPGASWFTAGIGRTKALTSVAMGMDSGDVADLAATYPDLIPVIDEQLPFTLTTLQGGVVVLVDGSIDGAVAVSGATPAQDEECARAGVDAWLATRT
jgi:glc operon protein GlcG